MIANGGPPFAFPAAASESDKAREHRERDVNQPMRRHGTATSTTMTLHVNGEASGRDIEAERSRMHRAADDRVKADGAKQAMNSKPPAELRPAALCSVI